MTMTPAKKAAGPGCCGPLPDRVRLIKQTSQLLSEGHRGLAEIYKGMAKDAVTALDRDAFLAAVEWEMDLSKRSLTITLPDDEADKVEKEAGK